jgi:hypothetical protein
VFEEEGYSGEVELEAELKITTAGYHAYFPGTLFS